jgi:hypothetical protein
MSRLIRRASGIVALAALVAVSALPADAAHAARTRPHGSSSTSEQHASGRSAERAPARAHQPPTRAEGHATYGYGYDYGYGYGYGYGGWEYGPGFGYGFYGPWWSLGLAWGWPGYWTDGGYYGAGAYPAPYGPRRAGIEIGPAFVETAVRPKKAQVLLDGEPIGQARDFNGTWDTLELDPGRHLLAFEARGYMTLEVGLEAQAGRAYRIAYALREGEGKDPRSSAVPPAPMPDVRPAPPAETPSPRATAGEPPPRGEAGLSRGLLKIRVAPADAAVYLDGEFLGRGDELARLHGAIPVASGAHRVEVVRPGFKSREERVIVGDGPQPAEVRIDLEKEGGSDL